MAERQQIPIYQFDHKERKDDVANRIRQERGVRDGIVFIGVAQEKVQAFQGVQLCALGDQVVPERARMG